MPKYRIHSGPVIWDTDCQVATVVMETAQLVLSQFKKKHFSTQLIENWIKSVLSKWLVNVVKWWSYVILIVAVRFFETHYIYFCTKYRAIFRRESSPLTVGAECRWVWKMRFSTNISFYLGNDTRSARLFVAVVLCRSISDMTKKLLNDYNREEPPMLGIIFNLPYDATVIQH